MPLMTVRLDRTTSRLWETQCRVRMVITLRVFILSNSALGRKSCLRCVCWLTKWSMNSLMFSLSLCSFYPRDITKLIWKLQMKKYWCPLANHCQDNQNFTIPTWPVSIPQVKMSFPPICNWVDSILFPLSLYLTLIICVSITCGNMFLN